jgi:LuxR family quorum-sensing system transcriptional regulator CciR
MSRNSDVQSFLRQSRSAGSPQSLARLLGDCTEAMGFDWFALVHHVDLSSSARSLDHMRRGEMIALSNYPEAWTRDYVENKRIAVDPVVLATHNRALPFRWDALPWGADAPPGSWDFREPSARFGIGEGFTVPIHFPGEPPGSCHFAVRPQRDLPARNFAMAETVGRVGFEAARALVLSARRRGRREAPRLTDRQLQCTLLAGRGLTEREIAASLGIAAETVKRHLKEARLSYGVSKTVQLVARAVFDGRIALADLISGADH